MSDKFRKIRGKDGSVNMIKVLFQQLLEIETEMLKMRYIAYIRGIKYSILKNKETIM